MRNENYNDVDPETGYGRGLTAEQQRWHQNWKDGYPFFTAQRRRELGCLGFKLKPLPQRPGTPCLPLLPLTTEQRFVPSEKVDIVTLTWAPEAPGRRQYAKQICYPALVQVGTTSRSGQPQLGGVPDALYCVVDFSRKPLQDHPLFLQVDCPAGELIHFGPRGHFSVQCNGHVLDLCVNQVPMYRVHYRDVDAVQVMAEGPVETGEALATLSRAIRVGQAQFDQRGKPRRDTVSGPTMSATRNLPLLRMLLDMDTAMNATALGYEGAPRVASLGSWAPRIMLVLSESQAENLTAEPGYRHSDYLENQARVAVGPDGDYRIRAKQAGVMGGLTPCQAQPHLQQLAIGEHVQYIPASAVLVDGLTAGSEVVAGQPIADIVPRLAYPNTLSLQGELEANYEWFLQDYLRSQMIWPGEQGWAGPGVLIDYRLASSVSRAGARWVYDFEPCYLQGCLSEEGYIVGPPFALPNPDDCQRTVNGVPLVFGAVVVPADRGKPSRESRKKIRDRERLQAFRARKEAARNQAPQDLAAQEQVPPLPDNGAKAELAVQS